MSEHTLDDLAARLEALGFKESEATDWFAGPGRDPKIKGRQWDRALKHHYGIRVWANEYGGLTIASTPYGDEDKLDLSGPDAIETVDAIRQWQASAEPAAPVVTNEMVARSARTLCDEADPDVADGAWLISDDRYWALKLALDAFDAADLAPEQEGARDGQ